MELVGIMFIALLWLIAGFIVMYIISNLSPWYDFGDGFKRLIKMFFK